MYFFAFDQIKCEKMLNNSYFVHPLLCVSKKISRKEK